MPSEAKRWEDGIAWWSKLTAREAQIVALLRRHIALTAHDLANMLSESPCRRGPDTAVQTVLARAHIHNMCLKGVPIVNSGSYFRLTDEGMRVAKANYETP